MVMLQYFGHIARRGSDNLERLMMMEKVGERGGGEDKAPVSAAHHPSAGNLPKPMEASSEKTSKEEEVVNTY